MLSQQQYKDRIDINNKHKQQEMLASRTNALLTKNILLTNPVFSISSWKAVRRDFKKDPTKYQRIAKLKKFDLSAPGITFPIRLPLRLLYQVKPQKVKYIDNTEKVRFERLTGNQILLAFENFSHLSKEEILCGLQQLALTPSQEKHDWNAHPWINNVFEDVKKNWAHYRKEWTLRMYKVMKKLNNKDPEIWKLIYPRVEELMHKFPLADFIYFWETYNSDTEHFSKDFRENILFKLMELRLRSFTGTQILNTFQIMGKHNKIDHYYLHNVFISLFKNNKYYYSPIEISEILRGMIVMGHENDSRFYDQFYPRILKLTFENSKEVQVLKETLEEVQDIFKSHRLEPYLEFLNSAEREVRDRVKQVSEKQLFEMVRQDLQYFKEKLRITSQ